MNKENLKNGLFIGIVSFLMAVSMSTSMLLVNYGFCDGFFTVLAKILLVKSLPISLLAIFILSKIFKKIKGKKSRVISGSVMGLVTSFFVTLTKTDIATKAFFAIWAKSFFIGFCIAAPLAIFYSIVTKKLLNIIIK